MLWKSALVVMVLAVGARAESPSMPEMGAGVAGSTSQPVAPVLPVPATQPDAVPPATPSEPAATIPDAATLPAAEPAHALRMMWTGADHASGIYYAREEGKISLIVENTNAAAEQLAGQVEFGVRPAGKEGAAGVVWKPLVVTPITSMEVGAKQRAKLEVAVTFGGPGTYELRWSGRPVISANGIELECIFPPRGAEGADKKMGTPWVAPAPMGAGTVAGLLADYGKRTGIRRVVLEDLWPTPVVGREAIFVGPLALNARQLDDLFADAAAGGVDVIVRVELGGAGNAEQATALHQHIAALAGHGKGTIKAIVVEPGEAAAGRPGADAVARAESAYRSLYLATYDAAKKADKNIALAGAGSIRQTTALLWARGAGGVDMAAYVDTWVADGTLADLTHLAELGDKVKPRPLWVLPGVGQMSPAALLAEGVKVVPVWRGDGTTVAVGDRGVTAHLFGGAALFERVRPELPPYIAVFQGDGYAVAAVAGLGAGTAVDKAWPGLAGTGGTLALLDDGGDMRVVDEAGQDVDCRVGDALNVPLDRRTRYVLQAGNAEDLSAVVRTAIIKGLPALEVAVTEVAPVAGAGGGVKVKLRNATVDDVGGVVRVLALTADEANGNVVGQQDLPALASGKAAEVVVAVGGRKAGERWVVEVETKKGVQRLDVK